jgi:hypothetical protein
VESAAPASHVFLSARLSTKFSTDPVASRHEWCPRQSGEAEALTGGGRSIDAEVGVMARSVADLRVQTDVTSPLVLTLGMSCPGRLCSVWC